jgi:metal-sulfur cluster biosynthetic enzyme
MATKDQVIESIKQCYDPEIPVNVYDLGLIYDLDVREDAVDVTMTLTSQGCPSAQQIPDLIRYRIQNDLGVPRVNVRVVWEPSWTPERISPEGRKILRLDN